MMKTRLPAVLAVAATAWILRGASAGGKDAVPAGNPGRNPVNTAAKGLPATWSTEEGKLKNVLWAQDIGTRSYTAPVIAGGRVFVATNNRKPRDPKVKGPRAVLMCFAEKDGKFLWQADYPMAPPEVDQQAKEDGLCSAPAVVGDHFYVVTPGAVVVCGDVKTGKTVWSYDLMKQEKVYPCIINSCSPLVVGDLVFVTTGNGVDNMGEVVAPQAPSFIALDRKTGKPRWKSNLPGKEILHGQWGSPAYADVKGRKQVIFPGGDNYLYSFEPETGKLLWKFRCHPNEAPKGDERTQRNYLITTPVIHGERVYVGLGHAPDTGISDRVGHFWCIDVTRSGDVSPAVGNVDPKSPANKKSALVWHFGGKVEPKPKEPGARSVHFGPTLSSAAVHDGLVYITDEPGYFYCLDAQTGKQLWMHDFKAAVWGSPFYADGKVYVGTDGQEFHVFAHGRQKKLLATIEADETVQSTPAASGSVLYVTTKSKLYAISAR